MTITKRDIADIVLVWMALQFILALLTGIAVLGTIANARAPFYSVAAVVSRLANLLILLVLSYVLLFRRALILDRIFPNAEQKQVSIPNDMTVIASYAFWIRLIGIFTFLTSLTGCFSRLLMALANKQELQEMSFSEFPMKMMQSGEQLLAAILALGIIWKADWIAAKLEKNGSTNQPAATPTESTPNADSKAS